MVRRTAECLWTQERLGASHPLVTALWATRSTLEQIVALAAVELAAGGLLLDGRATGLSLLVAASAVQAGLAFRLLVLAESRRIACLDLLVEGYPPVEIPAVAREWRRLSDPRRRVALARSVERLAEMAGRPSGYLAGARPYFSVRVIRAVVPELRELAALVRADDAPAPGVAFVERLMTCGTSPVYGQATAPLRADLARARYLLMRQPRPGRAPAPRRERRR